MSRRCASFIEILAEFGHYILHLVLASLLAIVDFSMVFFQVTFVEDDVFDRAQNFGDSPLFPGTKRVHTWQPNSGFAV